MGLRPGVAAFPIERTIDSIKFLFRVRRLLKSPLGFTDEQRGNQVVVIYVTPAAKNGSALDRSVSPKFDLVSQIVTGDLQFSHFVLGFPWIGFVVFMGFPCFSLAPWFSSFFSWFSFVFLCFSLFRPLASLVFL